jgi:hypothetical protein
MRMKASEVGGWLRQVAGRRDHREVLSDGDYVVLLPGQTHEISVAGPSLMNDDVSSRWRGEDHVHRKPGSASRCC